MTQTLTETTPWGSPVEQEIRRRIRVSVAAYAYEIKNTPIMSDRMFDYFAENINPQLTTGHPLLDEFFIVQFSPMTGMWIHQHPELGKIAKVYDRYYSGVIKEMFENARRRGKPLP